ncbi:S24 family peptidase [Mycetohabitans sp. B5]|uniref:Peptidase S24-like protein n=1 Tax=Mycetohabitans endofungorum TaxID=417203 RepID=A0A2P5K8F7_9BURK|nr:S24 family peptidase [Mycetohabitans endofungorum]MCG1053555.1 S24 family peptidase [Mycetohabitans sp. B5]PPB82980.1 peptidase S24-like protein [Mycetohabitans endofungorum]
MLHDGDNILINYAFTSSQNGIYVIRVDGQLLVKRLQRLHGPFLRVISANPNYPPSYEAPIEDVNDQRGALSLGAWCGSGGMCEVRPPSIIACYLTPSHCLQAQVLLHYP